MRALSTFVRRVHLRHWSARRLRTALTLLGVTTGVTLVVAIAVINSTLLSTVEDTARTMAGSADIEVAASDSTGLRSNVIEKVEGVDGVRSAIPILRSYTTLRGPSAERRVLVLGATLGFHELFHRALAEERSLQITTEALTKDGIFLSSDTATSLGVSTGQPVTAEVPTGTDEFQMNGSFSGALVDALETGDIALMPLSTAQTSFDREGRVDSVYVIAEPEADLEQVEADISEVVGPYAIVGAPGARASGFEATLNGLASLSSTAGTVALFVSAFVVFNTMSMSVVERKREISLTLALGATKRQVIAGFVGEAVVLGGIACLIGIFGGALLAKVMVQPGLDGLRVFALTAVADAHLEWSHALIGLGSGIGVSAVAAYLPARRILKVAPVEALRPQGSYEGASRTPSKMVSIVRTAVGVLLLVVGIGIGPLIDSGTTTGTWLTSALLLALLVGCTLILPTAVRIPVAILRVIRPRSGWLPVRLAADSLHRSIARTTVTIGALVFTLGIVIGVGGSLDSYRSEWFRAARSWYGGPLHVSSPSFVSLGSDQPLPATLTTELQTIDGVENVYAARYRIINIDGRQTTIYVVPYAEQTDDPGLTTYGQDFRQDVARVHDRGEVVISALAAKERGIGVGDEISIPTPTGQVELAVGAIANDLNPLHSMYLSNEAFLEHWRTPAVDRFELTLEEDADLPAIVSEIRRVAGDQGIPVAIKTKARLIADTFAPISEMFSVARAIQLAALIVAALAIANTMFITVLERRWEIGLQRAVGMDGSSVTRTLLFEAGAIGLIGGIGAWIVGVSVGFLMIAEMQHAYAFSFPFEIPLALMVFTLVLGGLIALLAGVHPSRSAIRTPIVEALRYE